MKLTLLLAAAVLALAPMQAQDTTTDTTLTITVTGTVSLISGPDCLGANGETATASVMISESAAPVSSTSDSAIYKVPAGGISATVGSVTFTSTKPWEMKVTLGASYDTLVLSGPGPLETTVRTTSALRKGSWTSAVLLHPEPFSPSPQKQVPSDSTVEYTAAFFCSGTTILGVTGSISNSAAASELPAGGDSSRSAPDATVTATITGTLGPVLSGSDPLKANGHTGMLTVMASESLSPTATTSNSATYTLPAGAMSVVIDGVTYKTTGPSTMKIALGTAYDTVILSATVEKFGITATVEGTADLKKGSFHSGVLAHPAPFQPTPQELTAASTAGGQGSKVQYTALGDTTVLGLSGSASSR
jgi:hypothetical protein